MFIFIGHVMSIWMPPPTCSTSGSPLERSYWMLPSAQFSYTNEKAKLYENDAP